MDTAITGDRLQKILSIRKSDEYLPKRINALRESNAELVKAAKGLG
jgi:hypothetical protein